jgi:5-hydroxyisourate hydrolase-like protein (transthyretin family)
MNYLSKAGVWLLLQALLVTQSGCSKTNPTAPASEHDETEPEPIARTEFTDRIENFFEYEPLHAGKPSQFRIHLTDLQDGTPVAQAQVTLMVHPKGTSETVAQATAKVGKVTGIYVADLAVPRAGDYDIEFHIKNANVDERLPLKDFKVE